MTTQSIEQLHATHRPTKLSDLDSYSQHGEQVCAIQLSAVPLGPVLLAAAALLDKIANAKTGTFIIDKGYGTTTVYLPPEPDVALQRIESAREAWDKAGQEYQALLAEFAANGAVDTPEYAREARVQNYCKKIGVTVPWKLVAE